MGDAAPQRRGRAWLYGLMLPKIQTDMLGTIPPCILWDVCAETYFLALFLGKHSCCAIPLMENHLFKATGIFWEGLFFPLATFGSGPHVRQAAHPTLPACAWRASVFFLVPVCALAWQLTGASSLVLQLFSFLCLCVYLPLCLFIPVHISIAYNNPLTQSHFSACDLSGSEFPISIACCCTHTSVVRGAEGQS